MKKFKLLLLLLFITSCATTERYVQNQSLNENELSTLYIYRAINARSYGDKPFIYLDDKLAAKLANGEVEILKVAVGKHRLSVRQPFFLMPINELDHFEVIFEPGKDYYLRYDENTFRGTFRFSLTTEEYYEQKR
jgi:hypothetical protein